MQPHTRKALAWSALTGLAMALVLVAITCHGCTPASHPTPTTIDYDAIVIDTSSDVAGLGERMQSNAQDWSQCIAGVVIEAVSDHALAVAVPVKQSVEAGLCSGQTAPVDIVPAVCDGLPGQPDTPEGYATARAEVAYYLDIYLSMAVPVARTSAHIAKANGDREACVALSTFSDLLDPAGDLVLSVLAIVESPGAAWTTPAAAWDCGWCVDYAIESAEPATVGPMP